MTHRWAQVALVIAVSLMVMFTNLGSARLWDRDEPRNAGCAMEMMQRGDWVTPTFNDELRPQKPILLYWLIISAYEFFGVNEFAARFWSAALAVGTVLLTFGMGKRLFSQQAGFWSALILTTCIMFVLAGRAATPDSILIFFSTSAIACYVFGTFRSQSERAAATESPRHDSNQDMAQPNAALGPDFLNRLRDGKAFPARWPYWLGMYASMAMAVLAKGPVGFVVPMAVIGMFMLLARQSTSPYAEPSEHGGLTRALLNLIRPFRPRHFLRTLWSMRPITAGLIVIAIAGPWYVLVGLRTEGDFLRGFFLDEHFGRATSSFENHSGPVYYYPIAMLVGFFPWSVFALPLLLWLDRSVSGKSEQCNRVAHTFLLCWVGVYVGVFTIAQTKLPSYVTPCYPGLALLMGSFIADASWFRIPSIRFWARAGCGVLAVAGIGLAVGAIVAGQNFLPGLGWLALFGAVVTIAGCLAWLLVGKDRWHQARITIAAASFVLIGGMYGIGTVYLDSYQKNEVLLQQVREHGRTDRPLVASFGVLESSWVFYGGHPIYEIQVDGSDRRAPSQSTEDPFSRPRFWKPKVRPDLDTFLNANDETFLITSESYWPALQSRLPEGFVVLSREPYFLQDEDLLLIGRAGPPARHVAQDNEGTELSR